MSKSIAYKEINNILLNEIKGKQNLNILEIGCGGKVYKDLFLNHNYQGLDMENSNWIIKNDPPEILTKFSNFECKNNYDLIFGVTALSMFDDEDLKKLINVINNSSKNKLKCFFFDWKKNTILKTPEIKNGHYNNYKEIIVENFSNNIEILNKEWCTENFIKKIIKKVLNLEISQIIKITFN